MILPTLSLYVHIPWCVRKCPYCDFNSHESVTIDEERYIATLLADLQAEQQLRLSLGHSHKLSSLFFGGGTPSLFSAKGIRTIIHAAETIVGFENDIEITLEANPGTVEQDKFSGFFDAGVNRLSIGVQSFNEQQLHKLGRIHSSDEAQKAVRIAKKAGFTNINIDLMHGLSKQTVEEANTDITIAINLEPQHISWYQLTIEPNTAFYRQPPPLPVDDILADIQYHGSQQLHQSGFHQYEISAFSQPGRQSKHNLNYWQFGDYIGIGAGAHGKLSNIHTQEVIRRQKTRLPDHYMKHTHHNNGGNSSRLPSAAPNTKSTIVDSGELALEFMMNVLRLNQGVDRHLFTERTGLTWSHVQPQFALLQRQGLLETNTSRIATTALGQRFLNSVLEKFSE